MLREPRARAAKEGTFQPGPDQLVGSPLEESFPRPLLSHALEPCGSQAPGWLLEPQR